MGKPTGFLEFTRENPGYQAPEERVKHYNEFGDKPSDELINQQAARCMDCGVPFCHSGCPLGNIIPEFNDAVYNKHWGDALEILTSTNNFPEFTGRICPAPCEKACVLGINQPPVNIEFIEKNIIETAFEKGLIKPHKPARKTGKKVAVVGAGPAGLACADQLCKAGHDVVVFERAENPGGLVRYGIPDFKLEKWIVERRVDVMKASGIEFRCSTDVGVDVTVDELNIEFDAIALTGGSTMARDLPIKGRQFKGIYPAMEFLSQQNNRVAGKNSLEEMRSHKGLKFEDEILATDKNVVVIGGGDTGSDCVGTSNRHGAKSITQFELFSKPPEDRADSTPWPLWPMQLRTSTSHEEGCDRKWEITTKEFVGDENGNLKALKIADMHWSTPAEGEKPQWVEKPGSEREIPCELALLAIGFVHPQKEGLLEQLGVELDQRGNVKADTTTHKTSVDGVFAAGDMRRGQSLVVWAIAEGRECAANIDEYLEGSSLLERRDEGTHQVARS